MDTKHSVEATGEDVELAIAAGLAELGVEPSDVMVEILEEPSRGVFGIGAKPARVRLNLLRPLASISDSDADVESEPEPVVSVDTVADESASASDEDVEGEDGEIGKEVLLELLEKMGIEADVIIRRDDPSRPGEVAPWVLDITGDDLSLLIGRRGETLNSLQYITRLIVSRKLQRRSNIIVDAGEYKSRRSQRLRQLALRMADQVVQQARAISLEPMPPNERRIIHLTLRNRSDVDTRSTGEGDTRKVTIYPK